MINTYNLDMRHAPFNNHYLHKLANVIFNAIREHPRTTVIRIDLHLPDYKDNNDSLSCIVNLNQGLMKRFIESLNVRLQTFLKNKAQAGIRTYPCRLRYAWVKERQESEKPHWHVVLFLNKDAFKGPGNYKGDSYNLASMIQASWLSALKLPFAVEYLTLVHFPVKPCYYLNVNKAGAYPRSYDDLMFRLSYMAKERSKVYCREERSFGCSQS
ncbi:inovirus Gp2 family protein [Salmonella enterica]|uniref:inovirus Gp2 family protein n=1 Tax=Salmonella enterica TaxID=28901 RepID=UPI003D31C24D